MSTNRPVSRTPAPRRTRPRPASPRPVVLLRALVGLLVVVGCEEVLVAPVPVASVAVVPADTTLFVDEFARLRAELTDDAGEPVMGREVTWSSRSPAVASVDATGLVVGMGSGNAEITATAEGRSGSSSITVLSRPRIELDRNSVVFSATAGTGNPAPVQVAITNGGSGVLEGLARSVSYETVPGGWLDATLEGTAAPTSLTLTALTGSLAAGTHSATVTIADPGAVNSPVDLDVTFQIQQNLPTPPSGLQASSVSATSITLGWNDNSDDETEFQLQRQAPGEAVFSSQATLGPGVTTYQDQDVAADGLYRYRVRACNGSGCSAFSNQATVTTPPLAPSGLTAQATGTTTVDLSWVDNSATETEFRVERRVSGGAFNQVSTATADATSFSDSGLQPDTDYEYRVRACNTGGCSSYSAVAAVTTSAVPIPAAPSALGAATVSATQIDLSWTDNSANETGFQLDRRGPGESAYTLLTTLPADATGHSDTTVAEDGTYSYRVRACGSGGCSSYSNTASATTPPTAPSGLSATAASDSRVDLTWTDNSASEASFQIERSTDGGATFTLLTTVAANVTGFTNTGLTPNTTYDYRVRACNAGGCSSYTATATATTFATPPPASPTSLTATLAANQASVDLAWTDNSTDEDEFRIQRSIDGGTFTQRAVVGANTNTFTDTNITVDNLYTYRVEACSTSGCSNFSNEASVLTVPAAPTSLGATAVSASQVDLTWVDASDSEAEFRIQRSTDGGATWNPLTTVGADVTGYSDNTTTADTNYAYRVTACNTTGCSPYSNQAAVTTPPTAPSGLGATVVSAGQIDLAWTDNSATEAGFQIERSTDGGATWNGLTTVGADVIGYSDNTTTADTDYAYRVAACNAAGCSAFSNTATATTPPTAPSGLGATVISSTEIGLSWTDNSGTETEFRIEQRPSGGSFAPIDTVAAGVTTYNDSGLSPSTGYDYRVQACNAGGCSPYSNTASATTAAISPPTGLGATVVSASRIDLAWTDNSTTETGFEIERSVNGGAFTALTTVGADVEAYSDNTTSVDTDYGYRVRACNASACSPYSNTATATTPPTAPSGLGATAISDTQIDLSWTDNSATETEFRIERRPSGGSFAPIDTVGAGVTAYSDTAGLSPATGYDYQVQACNAGGCSAYTATASATTDPIPAPSGLGATAISDTQIDLVWTDNSGTETGFEIERSVNGGAFAALTAVGADVEAYSDNTTSADTDYGYRVRACTVSTCSAYSNTATATTPPTAPAGLGATVVTATQIDLAWTDNSGTETGFQIERSVNGGAFTTLTTVAADVEAYSDNTTSADTDYAYQVRACNAAGCSVFSNTATATTRPTAASALSASPISDTQIDLSWTDNSATETEFQIERSTDGGTTWSPLTTVGADVTAYSDTALTPNTAYDYRVLACNASGCAPPSNTASATTLDATPLAPTALSATVISAGQIDLAWTDNATNEDDFQIERSTDGGTTWSLLATVGADVTTYSDNATAADTNYDYRVRACNTVGCSAFSNTAAAATPPSAPSGLTATWITDTQIDLAWTDNSTAETEFRIERSTDGGATWILLTTVGTDITAHSDLTTTTDTEYTYRVTACNLAGCSTASNTDTVITTPDPITGLTTTTISDTEIDLAWTDNSSVETEQIITRRISGGFNTIDTVGTNVTSYSDTGLQPLTSYTYRIVVCNADGLCTGPSSMSTSTTDSIPAPTGLGATVVSSTQVDLAWTHTSNGETEFQVERSTDGGATWNPLATVGVDVTAYSDNTTTADTDYAYRVRACGVASCSSYSNTATVTTPPTAASALGATTISDTEIDLSWTDNSATETEFRIERRTGANAFAQVGTVSTGVTTFNDTGLSPDTTYDYQVLACNAGGCAPPSNTASATTDPIPAPTGLGTNVISATQVDLAWTDNSATETEFQIQRSVNGGAFTALATVGANVATYSDNSTTADTNYTYRVAACHSTGCSTFSNTAAATTPPTAPSGLGATAISSSQIDLAWTDNSTTETSFEIERRPAGGTFAQIATVAGDAVAYSDTSGLVATTTYEYQIRACNAGGCSAFTAIASATTP